jgi:hypothetical protein
MVFCVNSYLQLRHSFPADTRVIYEKAGFKMVVRKHDSWSRKDLVAESWELNL